jgi:tetratricopeptide (TPR) repeat protein
MTNLKATHGRGVLFCLMVGVGLSLPILTHGQIPNHSGLITTTALTKRQAARQMYNKTLQRFFEDLKSAKSTNQLLQARQSARTGFLEAVTQDPFYPQPIYNLAVLATAEENWDDAIKLFQQFRQLDRVSALSLKAEQQLESLKRVRNLDVTPEAKRRRHYDESILQANVLLNLGLLQEAAAEAAQAVQIDDTRWEAYAITASALARQNLYEDVVHFLNLAVARSPHNISDRLRRALGSYRAKQKRQE